MRGRSRGQTAVVRRIKPRVNRAFVARLNSPIDLILLLLSVDIRTTLRRSSKIGEDGSTPLRRGSYRPE